MTELKFEAVKENEKKPDGKEKMKKNGLSEEELKKTAGIKKMEPKEEIRRAEVVLPTDASKKTNLKQEVISLRKERGVLPQKYDRKAVVGSEQDT